MKKTISDYRNEIFALSEKLSKPCLDRMKELAEGYDRKEKWYREDTLRRAVGHALKKDISGDDAEACKNFLGLLRPHFGSKKARREFESLYIAPMLDDDEEQLPEKWVMQFADRISDELHDIMIDLTETYHKNIELPFAIDKQVVSLPKSAFDKLMQDALLPFLISEREKAIEELLNSRKLPVRFGTPENREGKHTKMAEVVKATRASGPKCHEAFIEFVRREKIAQPTVEELAHSTGISESTW